MPYTAAIYHGRDRDDADHDQALGQGGTRRPQNLRHGGRVRLAVELTTRGCPLPPHRSARPAAGKDAARDGAGKAPPFAALRFWNLHAGVSARGRCSAVARENGSPGRRWRLPLRRSGADQPREGGGDRRGERLQVVQPTPSCHRYIPPLPRFGVAGAISGWPSRAKSMLNASPQIA